MTEETTNQPTEQPTDRPLLLSISAAARRLGVNRTTVRKMLREGRMRAIATTTGHRMIPTSELTKLVRGSVDWRGI